MSVCPGCGGPKTDMTLATELVADPPGSFSLAGVQTKVTASTETVFRCTRCGWAAVVDLVGNPPTHLQVRQVLPTRAEKP